MPKLLRRRDGKIFIFIVETRARLLSNSNRLEADDHVLVTMDGSIKIMAQNIQNLN